MTRTVATECNKLITRLTHLIIN